MNRAGRALAAGCYFTSVFTFAAFGLVTVLLFGWPSSPPFVGAAIGLGVVVPLVLVWLWFRG